MSCSEDGDYISVEKITLNLTTLTLNIGEIETLTATVAPGDATNGSVTWSSSNYEIASVDETGKVTAHSEGEATITVTANDNNKKASCVVTIKKNVIPVEKVILNTTTLTLDIGETEKLTATITPENATNKTIIWSSSDDKIASVDETGKVVAHTEGKVTIIASLHDSKLTAFCDVTVTLPKLYEVIVATAGDLRKELGGER